MFGHLNIIKYQLQFELILNQNGRYTTVVEDTAFPFVRNASEKIGSKDKREMTHMRFDEQDGSSIYEHRYLALRLYPFDSFDPKSSNQTALKMLNTMIDVGRSVGRPELFSGDLAELLIEYMWEKKAKFT